jgi:PEP-CTERM motif
LATFRRASTGGSTTDTTQDLHFDGFGYVSDAAATTGPHNGAGLQEVSFTVTQAGLTDVNDLLNLSGAPAGDGSVYFIVDAGMINGNTGLLGVTGTAVPEPSSYAFLLAAFGAVIWIARRRQKLLTGSQA